MQREAAALALCQKHHERLRLLFGSADQGEVVAEAAAAALVKEFCAALGIASTPPAVFVYLFRRHAAPASRVTRHTSHGTRHTLGAIILIACLRHGAAPGGINWYKAIEFICSGRSASSHQLSRPARDSLQSCDM